MIKDILDDVLLVAEAGATAAEVIERIINIGQQSGLMTDAETADYRAKVAARFKGPEFRTDAQAAAAPLPNPSA